MAIAANTIGAAEALSHPLVVWAAWLRVDEWYRSGNLAPQPELSQWRVHPEAAVRRLARKLQAGEWRPSTWLQVPYPKRGGCLRHYVMPTVEDQVAFMAHLVLLGPLLDSQFLPFVFGNRLHRPLAWNTRLEKPSWDQRGYPFLTRRTYLPYRRPHGLFRRVASWTVSHMTGASIREENYAGKAQHPVNYDRTSLPPWVQDTWWAGTNDVSRRAYWASIDIELAYPSVDLTRLSEALLVLMDNATLPDKLLDGYPQTLLVELADEGQRRTLSRRLTSALEMIKIDQSGIPAASWAPPHARATLPPENKGIPTGLAISGLLLNVALHRADEVVSGYLEGAQGKYRGAIVRFADDMYLLARSAEGIFRLIDVVWGAIEGAEGRLPIRPKSKSNLYVNLSKVDPKPVREAVRRCLKANGWEECNQCGEITRGPRRASLHRWWRNDPDRHLIRILDQASVGPGDVGPFVTTLVERLSEIGNDTLADRFGQGAKDRQVQLHDLARFDIEDEQVRADTRRTFAANRLVGAWLSSDQHEARRELLEVRRSVASVFVETPWKFALWGAVVRAAARRVPGTDVSHYAEDDTEAQKWLVRLLSHAAMDGEHSWVTNWPEEHGESPHRTSVDWRRPYLSFHRTAFWQSLAHVIRLLSSHHERQEQRRSHDVGPSPHYWTTRAVPEGLHRHVAAFLGDLDTWVGVLYGNDPSAVKLPRWELDHVVAACLARVTGRSVANSWRHCDQRVRSVAVPDGVVADVPATAAILSWNDRLVPEGNGTRPLGRSVVAQLMLTGRGIGLGDTLFADGWPTGIRGADTDTSYAVALAHSFNCEHKLAAQAVLSVVCDTKARMHCDPLALREYARARRVFLSTGMPWLS